jgi:hypothetical protein
MIYGSIAVMAVMPGPGQLDIRFPLNPPSKKIIFFRMLIIAIFQVLSH